MKAMQEEMESLEKNNTYELMKLPKGRKALRNKWVYKLKKYGKGNLVRYNSLHLPCLSLSSQAMLGCSKLGKMPPKENRKKKVIRKKEMLYKGNVGFLGETLSKFSKTHIFVLAITLLTLIQIE